MLFTVKGIKQTVDFPLVSFVEILLSAETIIGSKSPQT
jgi:hypothetical protein